MDTALIGSISGIWATAACALLAIVCYFLGCANGAILISRIAYLDDVRKHGSGNAGLTNFYRVFGAKHVAGVLAIDMGKAVIAVILGMVVFFCINGDTVLGKYYAAFFCIVGHMYPVTEKFQGGKGILSCGTILLLLDWRIALAGWLCFLVVVALLRYVSLGSLAGTISFPISTYFVFADKPVVFCISLGIALLIVFAHRNNIVRLLRGDERKLKFRRKKEEEER